MSIVKFKNLPRTKFSGIEFQNIIDDIEELIKEHPEYKEYWEDFLDGNIGKVLISIPAYVSDELAERIDWMVNELFLSTAVENESINKNLKWLNYRPRFATASKVDCYLKLSDETIETFRINSGYAIEGLDLNGNLTNLEYLEIGLDGKNINYINGYKVINPSESIENGNWFYDTDGRKTFPITFYTGTTITEELVLTGDPEEIIDLFDTNIIEDSIQVWLLDDDGNYIKELTQVKSFISPEAQAKDTLMPYKVNINSDYSVYLTFGNEKIMNKESDYDENSSGTFWRKLPNVNDRIKYFYRVGGGKDTNVSVRAINTTDSLLTVDGDEINFTIYNPVNGVGGEDKELFEEAKTFAPEHIETMGKTIHEKDYETILEKDNYCLKAKSYSDKNIPTNLIYRYGESITSLNIWNYIIPNKPGWENKKPSELNDYLTFTAKHQNIINLEHYFEYAEFNNNLRLGNYTGNGKLEQSLILDLNDLQYQNYIWNDSDNVFNSNLEFKIHKRIDKNKINAITSDLLYDNKYPFISANDNISSQEFDIIEIINPIYGCLTVLNGYIEYNISNLTGFSYEGCIEFDYQPLYSNAPSLDQDILLIDNDGSNKIEIKHLSDGNLTLKMTDKDGVVRVNTQTSFSVTENNVYKFSLSFENIVNRKQYFRVNGETIFDLTNTFQRIDTYDTFKIGNDNSNFRIDEFVIYTFHLRKSDYLINFEPIDINSESILIYASYDNTKDLDIGDNVTATFTGSVEQTNYFWKTEMSPYIRRIYVNDSVDFTPYNALEYFEIRDCSITKYNGFHKIVNIDNSNHYIEIELKDANSGFTESEGPNGILDFNLNNLNTVNFKQIIKEDNLIYFIYNDNISFGYVPVFSYVYDNKEWMIQSNINSNSYSDYDRIHPFLNNINPIIKSTYKKYKEFASCFAFQPETKDSNNEFVNYIDVSYDSISDGLYLTNETYNTEVYYSFVSIGHVTGNSFKLYLDTSENPDLFPYKNDTNLYIYITGCNNKGNNGLFKVLYIDANANTIKYENGLGSIETGLNATVGIKLIGINYFVKKDRIIYDDGDDSINNDGDGTPVYFHFLVNRSSKVLSRTNLDSDYFDSIIENLKLSTVENVYKKTFITPFDIRGKIYYYKTFKPSTLLERIKTALREEFNLNKMKIGESINKSYLLSILQNIEGVVYVELSYIGRNMDLDKPTFENEAVKKLEAYFDEIFVLHEDVEGELLIPAGGGSYFKQNVRGIDFALEMVEE